MHDSFFCLHIEHSREEFVETDDLDMIWKVWWLAMIFMQFLKSIVVGSSSCRIDSLKLEEGDQRVEVSVPSFDEDSGHGHNQWGTHSRR